MKRLMISVIAMAFLVAVIGGGAYYFNQRSLYVTTDNAQVKADMVAISPPATGKLKEWPVHTGDSIEKNEILGKEEILNSGQGKMLAPNQQKRSEDKLKSSRQNANRAKQPNMPVSNITSPISGVILRTNVVPGEVVVQGQPIAMVADLSKAYVLAYIDENQIADVGVGKEVDVELDAYPDQVFSGKVSEIGKTAGDILSAGSLSQESGGNSTKETERVPVKIAVSDFAGKNIILGMNAIVKIHK
ncbi:HlyD family secretion protein [Paenactinomyces guangxiensis]|uniref:Efflux RND transporter periplasmic adaptor subunit n=1 Tax=Paenactinomyces guangxiensis TaxID=1490290 RepID=A0A7W2A8A2_9BACL|nr:efflux RND transporter periplasmic adaptor subunit [Paenactinomyces guangxiensis]MBA4493954.1 efflux RND transporter periplasmic adaptor subunit [Paenactinomyces guangxiensis]MBH8591421.1 efflux RND transporter periplasmic adaptor subunit [Paenactinomyces guangxiensis]